LIAEGEAREFIRKVQNLRREAGLGLNDKIIIYAPTWPKNFEKEILAKTNSSSICRSNKLSVKRTEV